MGGRGASSGGTGGGAYSVSSIRTQDGTIADLTNYPLVYSANVSLPAAAQAAIDDFEQRHEKSKIEYATLVDTNGNVLIEKKGGRSSVSVPTYYYYHADVMSHNHPRGKGEEGQLGGTFSDADLKTFAHTPINTMRASAFEGTYSITKGSAFDPRKFRSYVKGEHNRTWGEYKKRQSANFQNTVAKNGLWSDYERLETDNFNRFLVEMHNSLLAGQSQYGYTYGLQKRS